MTRKTFDITGMSCAACSARVQGTVEKLDGIETCNVNLLKNSMDVSFSEDVITEDRIIAAVKKAGYGASVQSKIKTAASDELKKKTDKILIKLILTGMQRRKLVKKYLPEQQRKLYNLPYCTVL